MLTRRIDLLSGASAALFAATPGFAESWVDLGSARVSLGNESERIFVASRARFYSRLRLRVDGNKIFLDSGEVKFANGDVETYDFDAEIEEGKTTRSLDLPGKDRYIEYVEFEYRRKLGGGSATVTLQGLPR